MELPHLPNAIQSVISLLNQSASPTDLFETVQPYISYETKLREIFAQYPSHEAVRSEHLVPVFESEQLRIKARSLSVESDADKERYLLSLPDSKRRQHGSPATTSSFKHFKTNFSLFSEQSLVDLDWSNVVAAGSSVVTSLLPVDKPHDASKRAHRAFYHEQLAPASDVDLFIYGLDEAQAIEKIKQIERSVRDSVLAECTTIRTKNAITIVSEYPTRHVQIVLRLYKSVTEILTGFDVDSSCVAYDGKQVWASPRALAAFATQQNRIDLTRRSPSYENRLSKYSHRGFEVYWPMLDRSRVDPTIFERAFNRVTGLARLLVLEKLPHPSDRDAYAEKRRRERGRPEMPWNTRYRHALPGNVKDAQPDDVPDWLEDANHSDYHTFTIPYGPHYNAKRIEKLLFKQDLLLNAEWNRPKDRKTDLHRHPAFFGSVDDVLVDCCGYCPEPVTDEDLKALEDEARLYISGELCFMKDNPGRQAIGSFNPLTTDDWTDMAYTGSTAGLCLAIVDDDIEAVKEWFTEERTDVNRRDHTGRTPLQLACMCASPDIVRLLIERGARIVSRIYNGMTALHMAAHRGRADIVKILLDQSEANQEEEERKEIARKETRRTVAATSTRDESKSSQGDDDDIEMIDEDEATSEEDEEMTEGSFVKVKDSSISEDNENGPDVYDVDNLAWDSPVSALHLAIMGGHGEVIDTLITKYGADVMLPVKLKSGYYGPKAILSMILPIHLSSQRANETVRLLLDHGASPAQADANQITNLHFLVSEVKGHIIDLLSDLTGEAIEKVANHLVVEGWQGNPSFHSPLLTAIRRGSSELVRKLLKLGASPVVEFETFAKAYTRKFENADKDPERLRRLHVTSLEQPVIELVMRHQLVDIFTELVDDGIDINTMSKGAHALVSGVQNYHSGDAKSLLDLVQDRIDELQKYTGEKEEKPKIPENLPERKSVESDGYQSWLEQTNYSQALAIHNEQNQKAIDDLRTFDNRDITGRVEKQNAVSENLHKWETLQTKMIGIGAKTFKQLHPDVKQDNNGYRSYQWNAGRSGQNKDRPFENRISFQIPDLTDEKRDSYMVLFDAVHRGDEDTVKALCMSHEVHLQIAVQDSANYSPFSIAVLREHYDLARTIMDISAAQFQPKKEDEKAYRYSIRRPAAEYDSEIDSDDESDESDDDNINGDGIKVFKQLVDEKYTIDDIRVLSNNVKSKISPATLFDMKCELWRMLSLDEAEAKATFRPQEPDRNFVATYDDEREPWGWFNEMFSRERQRNSFSLFRFAIVSGNMNMLKFLLRLQNDLVYQKDKSETLSKLQMSTEDFDIALQLGRTDMISEIIRETGTLLPLANLAKKSGIQLDEKPQYYQGLSVYGQKRQDWAQRDQGYKKHSNADAGSPLLAAIMSGTIKTVEYFLSDTPLRCYEMFAKRFEENKNIQVVAKSDGGIERALHSWAETRSSLAIHMGIMADPRTSKAVRDFLIKRMPQFLNVRSKDGTTPLQLAFQLKHYEAAKELIDAGADQTVRNKAGENLLHTIYVNRESPKDSASFRTIVEMLDPKVACALTVQRCYGDGDLAQTPLMLFLRQELTFPESKDVLDAMLELSKDKDLEVMNGAGDYQLHSLVKSDNTVIDLVKYIVNRKPDLLFKENATGTTPLEVAENKFFQSFFTRAPQIDSGSSGPDSDITEIPPQDFLDPAKLSPRGTEYKPWGMYDTLCGIAEQYPRSRILVSLLDANETARRLAEQQQKTNEELKRREAQGLKGYRAGSYRRYGGSSEEDEEAQDEVVQWAWKASNLRKTQAMESTEM